MSTPGTRAEALRHCFRTLQRVVFDLAGLLIAAARSRASLAAENLFLRKQLALFQERQMKPHRAEDSTRWLLAVLSRLFDWRSALIVVQPDTLVRWHRMRYRAQTT